MIDTYEPSLYSNSYDDLMYSWLSHQNDKKTHTHTFTSGSPFFFNLLTSHLNIFFFKLSVVYQQSTIISGDIAFPFLKKKLLFLLLFLLPKLLIVLRMLTDEQSFMCKNKIWYISDRRTTQFNIVGKNMLYISNFTASYMIYYKL